MNLGLDDDELATCVSCGLCLSHCPTFRVTGLEAYSPRGRIEAMRRVERQGAPVTAAFVEAMETCVQCRGCETVCPSAVPFGSLMARTRTALAHERRSVSRRQRLVHRVVGRPRLLAAGSRLMAAAQRLRLVPRRLGVPRLELRQEPLHATGTDMWLFTGCVADAWDRATHRAVMELLGLVGVGATPTGFAAPCCGALAAHAGLDDVAGRLGTQVVAALGDERPIVTDVAGCGARLSELGHQIPTAEAAALAARVVDISEVLAARADRLPPPPAGAPRPRVAVHDPCHLRHVLRRHQAVRTVLSRYVDVVELDDEGLCCGAGGAYAATKPRLAADIRVRKLAAIERTGADLVASANLGCTTHLTAAGVRVSHPAVIITSILAGRTPP